jgi:hypothetical protein
MKYILSKGCFKIDFSLPELTPHARHRIFHPHANATTHFFRINHRQATVANGASLLSQFVPVIALQFLTGQLRVDRVASA